MQTEENRNLLAELFGQIKEHLDIFLRKEGRGSLHNFRVTAKQANTALRFLRKRGGERKAELMLRALARVFKLAGALRENQLQRQWLQVHRKPGLIRHTRLADQTEKLTRRLTGNIPSFLRVLGRSEKGLSKAWMDVSEEDRQAYTIKRLHDFQDRLEAGILPGRWHGARKRVKSLQHMDRWTWPPRSGTAKEQRWAEHLEAFQVAVGQWHDTGDMIGWLAREGEHLRGHAALEKECEHALILLEAQYAEQYKKVKYEMARLLRIKRSGQHRKKTAVGRKPALRR